MIARGRLAVEVDRNGVSRLTCLRSEGPLVLRPAAGGVVHLVGGAAGPLGGDSLRIDVDVGPGAVLELRTVAATVALPGSGPSVLVVEARIGPGGVLGWLPGPTVAASGCRHSTEARVVVDAGASLLWREELVRGRYGEEGGSVTSRLAVDVAGRPLLRHQLDVGSGTTWASPAVGRGARCAGSLLVVDPAFAVHRPRPAVIEADGTAVLPLEGPAAQVVALAGDAPTLRRRLDSGYRRLVAGRQADYAAPVADPTGT